MSTPGGLNTLLLASAAEAAGYEIERSLRFNSSDSAYLGATFGTPTDQDVFTLSMWVKRSALGSTQQLFGVSTDHSFGFTSGDALNLTFGGSSALTTTALFRDPSAWYHVVWEQNGTAHELYVNGVSVGTATATSDTFNTAVAHQIGAANTTNYFNGYLADVHFIDGQALDPTSFGEFDSNGIWQPIDASGLTYGTNGFHLDFSDNSSAAALGTDTSGNGNDWTPNNFSIGLGVGGYPADLSVSGGFKLAEPASRAFDSSLSTGAASIVDAQTITWTPSNLVVANTSLQILMQDFSGGVATVNSINMSQGAAGPNGNDHYYNYTGSFPITITSLTSKSNAQASRLYAILIDGVIVLEASTVAAGNDSLVDVPTNGTASSGGDAGGVTRGNYCTWNPLINGDTAANGNLDVTNDTARGTQNLLNFDAYWEITSTGGTTTAGVISDTGTTNTTTVADTKTYGFKLSAAGSLDYINITDGGSFTNITTGLTGLQFPYASAASATTGSLNAGQRTFAAAAPAGFKGICTANLPTPVVTKPSEYMDVKLYTGNGSTQTISGLDFSPDLVWIKNRAAADSHKLTDTVRGATEELESDTTDAEVTNADGLTAFNSDGFDLGADAEYNTNTETYVAWTWDAGSSTVTNTDGSITSTVRANASAGFSIVTYTGNGTAGATIGHGLGVAPEMIIIKNRDQADAWQVYHAANTANPETDYLVLNTDAATVDALDRWNDTAPGASVFTLGDGVEVNTNTEDYVAYCFTGLDGYSSFGSYTGNGSTDGPFVYTGHRVRYLLMKRTDAASRWRIIDTARNPYNVTQNQLFPEDSIAENAGSGSDHYYDLLSNGFKLRTSNSEMNASGGTYIYMSLAENPFSIARAR